MNKILSRVSLLATVFFSLLAVPPAAAADEVDWLGSVGWRAIGPARGGRAQAVTGVVGEPDTYYMGATGGGVWKTTDGGERWRNITDEFFNTGSVGAVAVAPSDSNVIYVGTGEADVRGNFSHGDGVYRSRDAGKTWEHVGLDDTRQIGHIVVHHADPDTVYVAALGHVFGPNAERGVFRSTDGGETWDKIKYVNDRTGAFHIVMDPNNPRVLFASFWRVSRTPWGMESGGEGSGLFRSADGGDSWEEVTEGLPTSAEDKPVGKICVSVSAAQRDLIYAIVEADNGGVFRSTDGGETWRKMNSDRSLRQRAWYYTHIISDPIDPNTVYVMNVGFHKSIDGGKTFSRIRVPHSDNHDLWIDPLNNKRMINANDGGANVSYDGGRTWSDQSNQPTAQFYRVTVDNRHPYRVYGAQQDNSTASVSSRGREFGGWQRDLYSVGGCECGYIAVHPEDPDIVYAGCYGGYMSIYDHDLGERREISIWPENPMGAGADVLEHRFQWTFPIVLSPHDPETVYVGGERVFRSTDRGSSWQAISEDLTTNDKSKQRSSGGPITKDNTSVEYYCTVFTIAESPVERGVIWAGTDDGLIHVSSDAGEGWTDVTPGEMGDWPMISLIEASPHDADTAYAAVNRYKMDDFAPYIYRTRDRGQSWELVVDGIDDGVFVRSIREDPEVAGLLYAATETGMWYSKDAGDSWESLQLELPRVPVTDIAVKGDDLVISTQGRSFWILDDLAVLRQMQDAPKTDEIVLMSPEPSYRERWDSSRVHFYLPEGLEEAPVMRFMDSNGEVIRSFAVETEDLKAKSKKNMGTINAEPGMNLFTWNYRHEGPAKVPGAVAWPGHPPGPRVVPGAYTVELSTGDIVRTATVELLADPRYDTTGTEYAEQFDLLMEIHNSLDSAHEAVNDIRKVRGQIKTAMDRAGDAGLAGDLKEDAKALREALKEIEETIIQTKSKSSQDPLNFPIRLNDKIGALAYTVDGDHPPTKQSRDVFEYLDGRLRAQLERLETVMSEQIPAFNTKVLDLRVPAIVLKDPNAEEDADEGAEESESEGAGSGGDAP